MAMINAFAVLNRDIFPLLRYIFPLKSIPEKNLYDKKGCPVNGTAFDVLIVINISSRQPERSREVNISSLL